MLGSQQTQMVSSRPNPATAIRVHMVWGCLPATVAELSSCSCKSCCIVHKTENIYYLVLHIRCQPLEWFSNCVPESECCMERFLSQDHGWVVSNGSCFVCFIMRVLNKTWVQKKRASPPCGWKSADNFIVSPPCMWSLRIHSSISTDSFVGRSYSPIVFTTEKKSTCKLIHTV